MSKTHITVTRKAFKALESAVLAACDVLSNEGRDAAAGDLESALDDLRASVVKTGEDSK